MQTRDQAQCPDTQPGDGLGWEHAPLGISKHFLGTWCKGQTPQGCTLVQSTPLSRQNEVKTTTVSALQPGCALVHLAGSWEPVEEPLF